MEKQFIVLVKDGDPAVARILESIGALANVEVNRTSNASVNATVVSIGCKCCGLMVENDTLEWHGNLGGMVCLLCIAACEQVESKFRDALNKHSSEFYSQLQQMVRDVRCGNDMPTFYQGFE